MTTNMLDYSSQRELFRILLAFLFFCLQMPGIYASKLLQLDPPSIVVRHGSPASVNCSTNVTHEGIGWEASQGSVDMMFNVQLITWTVKSLQHWDIKPICYINADEQDSVPVNIIVYKPPDQVFISSMNHTNVMTEGRQYEFQCDVQNVAPARLLIVKWYKEQELIKHENFFDQNTSAVDKKSTLQISPRRDDDGVQYRCEAELKLGPEGPQPPPKLASDPLNITVHFGPEINCSDVIHLKEGERLTDYCKVTGNPFPHFYWQREQLTIDPSVPLNRTSSGEYKIIINGNDIKFLRVEVIYGPEISCGLHYIVPEGDYFIPNCTVVGYPPTETIWYKDEDVVEFPKIMHRNDAGQYTLTTGNRNTFFTHTLEINVLYPPTEITELHNAQPYIGEDAVLKCSSNAKPRPTYKWIYHQTANVQIENQDGVSLLHINHAGGDNIGTYTCIAYNDLGEVNQTVRVDVQGAKATCPLIISPPHVYLEYGKSVNLECHSDISNADLSWKISDTVINSSTLVINSTWFVDSLGWNGHASCHGKFVGLNGCQNDLDVIIYNRPDQVFIRALGHAEPMIEGKNYTLQCDITNVAPVQFLIVNWYEGQKFVGNESFPMVKELANITSTLRISPSRNNPNIQYRCEAELKLGPKSPFKVKSHPLDITVHYKPTIKEKMPQWVPLFDGYQEVLVCEATGYPKPTFTWIFNNDRLEAGNMTVIKNAGEYTCIASNSVGNDTRVVTVVLKEDYLPLIAGFVALVVVIISVIFISIYSIYYKNTKMGHYTVEGAKPKAQNGNVAQNGKDNTIPMKKIMV